MFSTIVSIYSDLQIQAAIGMNDSTVGVHSKNIKQTPTTLTIKSLQNHTIHRNRTRIHHRTLIHIWTTSTRNTIHHIQQIIIMPPIKLRWACIPTIIDGIIEIMIQIFEIIQSTTPPPPPPRPPLNLSLNVPPSTPFFSDF